MKVSILICTYNRADLLDRTLSEMANLAVPRGTDLEVVVVDNNSTDDTAGVIARHARGMPVVPAREERQGLSFARNTAVAMASGRLILWTDDDVLVDRDWLSEYVDAARRWPEAAFLGGPIEPHFGGAPPKWVSKNLSHLMGPYSLIKTSADAPDMAMRGIDHPIGANMAFRAGALKGYPFDCALGRAGGSMISGEDTDVFRRLIADGYTGVWVAGARVRHHIGPEKQTLRYIINWYAGNGRTAARIIGPGHSPREAVGLLARTRTKGRDQPEGAAAGTGWWSAFFCGPPWLRAVKASAYFWGFHQEITRSGHRGNGPGGSPAGDPAPEMVSLAGEGPARLHAVR